MHPALRAWNVVCLDCLSPCGSRPPPHNRGHSHDPVPLPRVSGITPIIRVLRELCHHAGRPVKVIPSSHVNCWFLFPLLGTNRHELLAAVLALHSQVITIKRPRPRRICKRFNNSIILNRSASTWVWAISVTLQPSPRLRQLRGANMLKEISLPISPLRLLRAATMSHK